MNQCTTPLQPNTATAHFGICPKCKEEHFLSVPTLAYGLICIYCLHDLYPPNGLERPLKAGEKETTQERTSETPENSSLAISTVVVE
jgi:hypothetical protein